VATPTFEITIGTHSGTKAVFGELMAPDVDVSIVQKLYM
jgi:hypothetical protein